MNLLLLVLQIAAALLYAGSGYMKIFMIDEISRDVAAFGALPREVWIALGALELLCVAGLIVPLIFRRSQKIAGIAATVLALESLVFVGVHMTYQELAPTILSGVLGLVMVFIAYGRIRRRLV